MTLSTDDCARSFRACTALRTRYTPIKPEGSRSIYGTKVSIDTLVSRTSLVAASSPDSDSHSNETSARVRHLPEAISAELIPDESSLRDFHSEETNNALCAKIRNICGVYLSDIQSAKLTETFDRISSRS
jgi:hypothetical protein